MPTIPHSPPSPHLRPSRRGQGLVEYALILVLVAIVVVVILAALGPGLGETFSTVVGGLRGITGAGGGEPERDCEITFSTDYHGAMSSTLSPSILGGADGGSFYWSGYGSLRYRITDSNPEDLIIIMNSGSWHARVSRAQYTCDPYPNK